MRSLFSNGQRRQSVPTSPQAPVQQQPQHHQQQPQQVSRPAPRIPRLLPLPRLSNFSTSAVPNSAWSSVDFMLGAGMVIIQPSTQKIVVVYETEKKYWFLPRGRKDVGESLEQAALREAYEETGYQAEFLPLLNPTHQPVPPHLRDDPDWLNTEPMYVTLTSWHPRRRRNGVVERHGGEYLTMWYAGQISEEATPHEGTGMPDEQNYKSHLLTIEDALDHLWDAEKLVLAYIWRIFCNTEVEKENIEAAAAAAEVTTSAAGSSADQQRQH